MSVKKSELFTYHPMHINDLECIYKLELESYSFPWTKEILRDCILYKYDSYSVFIDDTLVGYIISKISFPETHILNLTVDINYRNNGIGQALIELTINDARIRNSQDIILEVRSKNLNAQALYSKLGFEKIGIRKGYYDSENGREDAFVLRLKL